MTTLVAAWTKAKQRLAAAGVDSPVIDARLLVQAAADATRADIITDPYRRLSEGQEQTLEGLLERRERREPISHILGETGFWTLTLKVTPDVLTPRPETESILDAVLGGIALDAAPRVLDLGVGSGALLLAILSERPHATGVGVDRSEAALAVARENVARLGLAERADLRIGDWADGLDSDDFDLVVANPPYIPTAVIEGLAPEARDHDPRVALDGGADGLDAYRRLAPEILRVLKAGGRFAVEIGFDQAVSVTTLFRGAGALDVATRRDLGNRDRVILGRKKTLGQSVA